MTNLECPIIGHSGRHDVLFSKGGNTGHSGNMKFQNDVEERLDQFVSNRDREFRRKIHEEIVACVEARNGRFLQLQERRWWGEISPEKVHEKVTASLYDCHRRLGVRVARSVYDKICCQIFGMYKTFKKITIPEAQLSTVTVGTLFLVFVTCISIHWKTRHNFTVCRWQHCCTLLHMVTDNVLKRNLNLLHLGFACMLTG